MNSPGLRSALAAACLALAAFGLPAGATASTTTPAPATPPGPAAVPGQVVVGYADGRAEVRDVPAGASIREAAASLRGRPGVRSVAPNWLARAAELPVDQGSSGTAGGWASEQWNFGPRPGGIRVAGAWDQLVADARPGGAGVVVAVVDSGIAYANSGTHAASPDFGAATFAPGVDLVDDDAEPLDESGHGTHVAGTIAEGATFGAPSPTPDFLTGIAYGVTLMPVRVLDADGVGSTDDVATGILWAARNGADVINVSLNFDPAVDSCRDVPTVCGSIRQATRLGALVVASAGNQLDGRGRNGALYPGAAPGAFAVGATSEDGCLARYSYFGRRTDLLAPGGGNARAGAAARPACGDDALPIDQLTYACYPTGCASGEWGRFAIRPDVGTSMSAAHASGVAALVIASGVSGPDPGPKRLASRLQCTAAAVKPKRFYGAGRLDALRAVNPLLHCDARRR